MEGRMKILSACLFLLACNAQCARADNPYFIISEYLQEVSPSNVTSFKDANENIKAAEGYRFDDSELSAVEISQLELALKDLTSLDRIYEGTICDQKSYGLLEEVGRRVGVDSALVESLEELNRVQQVFLKYSEAHSDKCIKRYIDRFTNTAKLNEEIKERAEAFESTAMDRESWHPDDVHCILLTTARVRMQHDLDRAHTAITQNSGVPSKAVDAKQFEQLYNQHLLAPCKDYLRVFGPDLFESLRYDFSRMSKAKKVSVCSWLPLDFVRSYAHYNVCKSLLERPDRLKTLAIRSMRNQVL